MTVQHFDSRSICKVPACFTLLYSGDFCEFLLLLLFSVSDLTSLRAVGWWRVSFYFSQPNKQKKAFGWGVFLLNFLSSHWGLHASENLWEPANLLTGYELLKECDEEPSLLRGSNTELKIHDVPGQAASCQTRNPCAQPPNPFRPPSADAALSRRFSMDGGGRGGRKEQGHLPADASPQC